MKIKVFLFALIINLYMVSVWGQEKDFGMWYGANINHEIFNNFEFELGATLRTIQNASHTESFFINGGLSYKLNKYIALSANYRWILKDESFKQYYSRHRFYSDLKLSYPLANFKFSARARFQSQYKTYIEEAEDKLPDYYFRLKTQIYYNWPFSKFNPFISAEWFYPLNYGEPHFADQKRFAAGIEYKITKKHAVDVEYIFQREYIPGLSDLNIVSLTYNFEL